MHRLQGFLNFFDYTYLDWAKDPQHPTYSMSLLSWVN